MTRVSRLQVALGAAIVIGGVIATRAAIAEKRVETTRREGIAALLAQIDALAAAKGHATLHVTFNGVGAVVSFTANDGKSIDQVAREAVAGCGEENAGGDTWLNGDATHQHETREAVSREDAREGAAAVFCVTRGADGARTTRMTFVQADVTTIVTTRTSSIDAMFPRDGTDVPGDDLAHVRPADSQRVGAATVFETGHAVRMYDLAHASPGDLALDDLDRRMKAQGFVSSTTVARDVEGMRLYSRDGRERLAASFERDLQGNVTRVTIARVNLP